MRIGLRRDSSQTIITFVRVWDGIFWMGIVWLALLGTSRCVEMDIRLDSVVPRSMAPIPVSVTLESDRPHLEGRLHILLKSGAATLIDHRTEPIILKGEIERRFLLPPIQERVSGGQAEWILAFEAKGERFETRDLYVTMASAGERVAVVAMVHQDSSRPPAYMRDFLNEGRLETLMGYDGTDEAVAAGQVRNGLRFAKARTWQAAMPLVQFPAQPLWLCGYDVVALAPDSLAGMSELQVGALVTWVRGGGSLLISRSQDYLVPRTAPMTGLLERLERQGQPAEILDGATQAGMGVQLATWQWDLGRVALIDGLTSANETGSGEWRQVFNFLWNVRDLETVTRRAREFTNYPTVDHWRRNQSVVDSLTDPLITSSGHPRQLTQVSRQQLARHLMPENVRLLPVGQLAWIVLGFLFLVGPIEYRFLKRLKRRWLTWLVFPMTIVLVTFGAFLLGDALLGKDSLKKLTVIDLGSDGQEAVRRSQVALVFSRGSRRIASPQEQALVSSVQLPMNRWQARIRVNLPTFEGRYPTAYQMTRQAERWTPYMEQKADFARGVMLPDDLKSIDWQGFHPRKFRSRQHAEMALADRLQNVPGFEQALLTNTPDTLSYRYAYRNDSSGEMKYRPLFQVSGDWDDNGLPLRQPKTLDWRWRYHTDSQASPAELAVPFPRLSSMHGGSLLIDWIVPDHEQWLIVFNEGTDQVIYRYIYPEHPPIKHD